MNIQEYISSGIVESYVLGLAEPSERAEFERMCAAHAEVRAARDRFELELEEELIANGVTPPKSMKSKIFAEIEIESEKIESNSATGRPGDRTYNDGRPLEVRSIAWQRYVAAASIALLLLSTAFNFYLFNQYKDYSARYESLVQQQTDLAKNNEAMQTRLTGYENTIAMMKDPDMAVIKMPGTNVATSPDSNSVATVYWNTKSKDVYLLVNNLPQPPSDQQYQLWAIVDGQPIDAGVFDMNGSAGLLKMKTMPRAQVFAITLEKRGGSPTPQGPMYVLGKVS